MIIDILNLECHEACKGGCSNSGPENCNDCKEGWTDSDSDLGCIGIEKSLLLVIKEIFW